MSDIEQYLLERIKEDRAQISADISRGHAKSYDDYRFAVGRIRGLDTVVGFIADYNERVEKDDE